VATVAAIVGAEGGGNQTVNVQEVRKLDAFLKRRFDNPHIRLAPKKGDAADVLVGEERIGELSVDDDDDERSYNFQMKITLGEPAGLKNLRALEAYLRHNFGNEQIRLVPRQRKTDSVEVCIGEEYIGVLFFDEKDPRSCFFEMPILEFDLGETGEA
jgi:hypothetical protein